MIEINKQILTEFSKEANSTAFLNAYSHINEVLVETIEKIQQRNPYIKNYQICVANEVFSECMFDASVIDIFVVFDAVQIELNCEKQQKNFGRYLKMFFTEFKNSFKLFRSKKSKKKVEKTEKKAQNLEHYDVKMLYEDLMTQLSTHLYKKTKLYIDNQKIKIIGTDEFGIEINLYPVFKSGEFSYKLYNLNNYRYLTIDFNDRFENMDYKQAVTLKGFYSQIRVFNNLYWNILKEKPNQIFIESILYDCPENLFVLDSEETTINLINYLKNSTMQNKKSICDLETNLFDEKLNTTSYTTAIKFLNNLMIK